MGYIEEARMYWKYYHPDDENGNKFILITTWLKDLKLNIFTHTLFIHVDKCILNPEQLCDLQWAFC